MSLSYLRVPIGASDFALNHYTYDDMPQSSALLDRPRRALHLTDAGVKLRVQRVRRILADLTEHGFNGVEQPAVDLLIDRAGQLPGDFAADPFADCRLVLLQHRRDKGYQAIQKLGLTLV
jgi:hypothetical protein